MAKKVIRLTEQDVERLVKKIIKEGNMSVDHMDDDDLGWAEESVEDGNGFDWLYNEPPSRMVGMVFDWDGNIYEVIDAFDASEPDEMGEPFYGEYGEPEEGIWFWAIDPETGEEYDQAVPMDAVIDELESGIATLISYGGKNYN